MSSRTAPDASPTTGHSRLDDAAGLATGAFLCSVGLFVLSVGGTVTGGTAGLSLLLAQATPLPFAAVLMAVSAPFVVLAVTRKGWGFTLRSGLALALVAALSTLHPAALDVARIEPAYAALTGNLLIGIGLLVLFRHGGSLGGFNVVALLAQERLGLRAGYVQLGLDALVVAASATVAAPSTVLLSAGGVVVLNLVLAMNHRPGRYVGA